jgi:hypothetical protein
MPALSIIHLRKVNMSTKQESSERKLYQTPVLRKFGNIRTLTLANQTGPQDDNGQAPFNRTGLG